MEVRIVGFSALNDFQLRMYVVIAACYVASQRDHPRMNSASVSDSLALRLGLTNPPHIC